MKLFLVSVLSVFFLSISTFAASAQTSFSRGAVDCTSPYNINFNTNQSGKGLVVIIDAAGKQYALTIETATISYRNLGKKSTTFTKVFRDAELRDVLSCTVASSSLFAHTCADAGLMGGSCKVCYDRQSGAKKCESVSWRVAEVRKEKFSLR